MPWRITTEFTGPQGSPAYCVMTQSDTIGYDTQNAVTALGTFWESVDSYIKNSVTWTVLGDVVEFDEATGQTTGIISVDPVTGTGDSGGDMVAAATSILIRWRTGVFIDGREVRGRTFVPYTTDAASTSGGFVSAAAIANIEAACATLLGDEAWGGQVYSKKHFSAEDIISGRVWNEYAVMRSRRD